MRTLMTLVTLGAAGAGYVYLNGTPVTGDPYLAKPDTLNLFDWNQNSGPANATRVSAKDLFQQIHDHTQSIFDDITVQHSGHSDAPVDDAFQRLQQVTQSVVLASTSDDVSVRDAAESPRNPIVPLPAIDELQRTAFDPASDSKSSSDAATRSAARREASAANSKSASTTVSDSPLDSTTAASNRSNTAASNESNSASTAAQLTRSAQRTNKPESTRTTTAALSKSESSRIAYEWKTVGKTTQGLPMHTVHLGDGGTRTLVIAGLNGEDRTAVRWLELLLDELVKHPELLKTNEFVFFRAGNPDGLVRSRRENARGVLINRNFPSRRYRPAFDAPTNVAPASELETRVILDTLYTFRPRRVIHLSSTPGRSQVLYNRLAKNAAVEFERNTRIKLAPMDAEQYPGSIEDFSEGTLEAAVLSMQLSVGNDWNQAFINLQPPLLATLAGSSLDASANGEQIFDPDRTPIPQTNTEPVSRPLIRRGYEELPPPPE